MTTPIDNLDDFAALDPFFRIIEEGLAGSVDGPHFFDLLAEDVVFEFVIAVPGYPRRVVGRRAVAELYRGYGSYMVLRSADELAVHRAHSMRKAEHPWVPRLRASPYLSDQKQLGVFQSPEQPLFCWHEQA